MTMSAAKFGTRTINSVRCDKCKLPGLMDQSTGHKCYCGGTLAAFVATLPNDCTWCEQDRLCVNCVGLARRLASRA
jgi:hypothetical protein